ncbi:hypothetical protein PG996_011062 [Apiospora saccharicola]|uniref:Uncharacterized protein n=1 Tax=Apiospora saccharicola TaxID=335842 RepID=A0ABR1UGB7_9PEZI
MDYDQFSKLLSDSPEAVFHEFKARSFLVLAQQAVMLEQHNGTKAVDETMDLYYRWARALADQIKAGAPPKQVRFDGVDPDAAAIQQGLIEQIADRDADIRQKDEEIGRTTQSLATITNEVVRLRAQLTDRNRADTPATNVSDSTGRRSAKVPNPQAFTDDTGGPTWGTFYNGLMYKLSANADHFTNDAMKYGYIAS